MPGRIRTRSRRSLLSWRPPASWLLGLPDGVPRPHGPSGRLARAAIGGRFDPGCLLAIAVSVVVVAASAVVWWNPGADLGALALPVAGLALAAIVSALMTLTPRWIGVQSYTLRFLH